MVGFEAYGETTKTWKVETSYKTPSDQRLHGIVVIKLRQTWDLWEYVYPSRVVYRAILVSSTGITEGFGFIKFNQLADYGVWATDRTGMSGAYSSQRILGAGLTMGETLEYTCSNLNSYGFGYYLNLYGFNFKIYVETKSDSTTKTEVSYTYNDPLINLDFNIESNYDIDWEQSQPYSVDGISIWFDE